MFTFLNNRASSSRGHLKALDSRYLKFWVIPTLLKCWSVARSECEEVEIVCRDIILLPDRRERGLLEFITEQI